jgi:geranylgeranyl transferase type-2 subunit beta
LGSRPHVVISYLGNLTLRLAAGAAQLDGSFSRRQAEFFRRRQTAEGGFAGREGPADLYYTGFALRGLALVDELDEPIAEAAAGFLRHNLGRPMPSIDFLSLVYSAVLLELACGLDVFAAAGLDPTQTVVDALAPLRRRDGGYAKTSASGHSSTYHTFLAVSCRQLIGIAEDEPERTVELIRSRQRPDGGFVELGQLRQSGTNPTAAAVGLLRLLSAVDESTERTAAAFLSRMQNVEGGLRANTRIPVADLLSTFTGLVAIADLDAASSLDLAAVRRYVETLELDGGGFRGGGWDDKADVEYAFYGLATLALLADLAS